MSFPATIKFRSARFNEKAYNYQLFICGSEKETATAWLAAATTQLSPHLLGKTVSHETSTPKFAYGQCNLQYKNGAGTGNWERFLSTSSPATPVNPPAPKTLQPFKEDRVRRTSILRQSSPFASPAQNNNNDKKKVSFADACGHQLESVRYIAGNSQAVHRRYSSNTAPTYLYNQNSPWSYGGSNPWASPTAIGKSQTSDVTNVVGLQRSFAVSNVSAASSPVTVMVNGTSDVYGGGQQLLSSTRYELVTSNFTSPSLRYNFSTKLEGQSVLLHSLTTAETTIYGIVSVANRHFTKRITVRYSFNDWKTYIEREGTYMLGSHDGRSDKFSFVIYARPADFTDSSNLTNQLSFAIRYTTGDDHEYWDNNDGNNYCLTLKTH